MELPDVTTAYAVEILRRSIAMLYPGRPALNREAALIVLGKLVEVLHELDHLRADEQRPPAQPGGVRPTP